MTKTALILVDLQNDFMPGGALAVNEGDQLPAIANALMDRYDLVVATQDWHPADHGSFAANHEAANVFDLIDLNGLEQVLWPVHCVQETNGAAFHQALDLARIDKVFAKGCNPAVDSYSGFFDNGKRQSTGMADYLIEQDVKRLDIMGLATDYCVKFTSLDAVQLGFETYLLVDACRAVNMQQGDDQRTLADLVNAGVQLVNDLELTLT